MKLIASIVLSLIPILGFSKTDTVHVVFKTHMDVGFTDFAPKVIEKYLDEYIPNALQTAREFQKEENQKYIWTTGSWIFSEYLRHASPLQKKELESAIQDGLICWNAYPFTSDGELMDASLFRHALSISKDLDQQFGKQTIAAKITDVPGETMGAISILQEDGIQLVHIGVNPASTRPDTPEAFLWKDEQGAELIVLYADNYGESIRLPDFNHILQFAFTGDNKGPHTTEEVKAIYQELNLKFPGAVIMASTLNDYTSQLWKIKDRLPVISSEIGNTWIHSAGTDPRKYAELRALMRLRTKWLSDNKVSPDDPQFKEFSTYLLMLTEHTGGLDEKSNIDFHHYSVDELAEALETPSYQRMEQSWKDVRAYVNKAIDALGDSPLADEARQEVAKLKPRKPDLKNYRSFSLKKGLQTEHFDIVFDPVTGAIRSLRDIENGTMYADESVPIGLFWQESFSEEDYEHWADQYLRTKLQWAMEDFCKPNVGQHGAVSARRLPKVSQAFIRQQKEATTLLLNLKLEEIEPTEYGLPEEVWLQIGFPSNSKEIRYTLQWFDMTACRLPESYWFSMGISTNHPGNWKVEKINSMISPLNVVSKGGRSLHGFNRGLFYEDPEQKLMIESLDCPIVAPGIPSLLDFSDQLPDLEQGWHFNLFNNKWGTNFPTWYSDDAKFRFNIHFN